MITVRGKKALDISCLELPANQLLSLYTDALLQCFWTTFISFIIQSSNNILKAAVCTLLRRKLESEALTKAISKTTFQIKLRDFFELTCMDQFQFYLILFFNFSKTSPNCF